MPFDDLVAAFKKIVATQEEFQKRMAQEAEALKKVKEEEAKTVASQQTTTTRG